MKNIILTIVNWFGLILGIILAFVSILFGIGSLFTNIDYLIIYVLGFIFGAILIKVSEYVADYVDYDDIVTNSIFNAIDHVKSMFLKKD